MLAHVAFFPEQIAEQVVEQVEQVVEGVGGDELHAKLFAMMTNGTCIHDGKVITVSEVSRGQETNPFQQEHSDDIR